MKFKTKTVDREFFFEHILEPNPDLGIEEIQTKTVDTTRWGTIHELIFKWEDKYYSVRYETVPENGIQLYGNTIECTEVEPKQVTVTKYVPKEL